MKNLKSVFAVILVLVIGVCLTGCGQNSEQEVANKEFNSYVEKLEFQENCISIIFADKAWAKLNYDDVLDLPDISSFSVVSKGETSNPDVFGLFSGGTADGRLITKGISFYYPESVQSSDIESLSLKVRNKSSETITLTYYPNPE
ncbi:MAG: hypothetical protein LBM87_06255 [Ruminococcus sp.]|nr:hypothetical protein [Ruminococcus sp.]